MSPKMDARTLWLAGGLLVAAAGWSNAQAPAAQPAGDQAKAPAAAMVISPGALGGSQLYQSWPLILTASVWRESPAEEGAAPPPITIKAKEGAWCEALMVAVKDAGGAEAKWPLHLVAQEAAELALDDAGSGTVQWWLAPDETQALAEGEYVVTAAFDPEKVDGLPTDEGAVKGDTFHIQVAKEPEPLDPELQQEKLYQSARLCIVRGDTAGAAALATQLLAADPESIGGRRLQAALLAREGKASEALALMDEALEIYYRKYPEACPPAGLLAERDEVAGALPKPATVESVEPPEGTDQGGGNP
jgi:hypothetical protein